jgi:hypothetical protein
MTLRGIFYAVALSASVGATALAESVEVALRANISSELTIDSKFDDSNFTAPLAYREHGSALHLFQRRLTLTNTGSTPLTGPLLIVNSVDWSRPETLRQFVAGKESPAEWLPRLFSFWCSHVSHADSDAPGGKEPFALLNFWGYALCGDTTAALTHFVSSQGVQARKIPLNGHVAAEYFYNSAWHILDTDQNITYLQLDNRTLASAADLRGDPFLARRTKVFGRYEAMNATNAAFNTSLHEYIDPKDGKPVSSKTKPAPVRDETLFPGEKMILYGDQPPGQAVGRTKLTSWGSVREDALRLMEFAIKPAARSAGNSGEAAFASGYPILAAMNHTTGEATEIPPGQPTFEIKVPFRSPEDEISVYCQRAKASLPTVRKGQNTIQLAASDAKGTATLVVEWQPAPADLELPTATASLTDGRPTFAVQTQPNGDHLWWQISASKSFDYVAPNLDAIIPAAEALTVDPLTSTFLNPGQSYFLRIKSRQAQVWGDWSAPLEFQVSKPARPAPAQTAVSGNRLRLSWPDAGVGCEYLIFGSNRLDFLPEPFAAEEIVKLRDQAIEESRPNKNLVATVAKPEIEFEPTFRFYRVITRKDGVLSVPGDLLTTPASLAVKLPPATVLQDRWKRVSDPKNPGAETDQHLATETPLR